MAIIVTSKEKAWAEVNKIFPTDYEKDYAASSRAGYDIYRHNSLNYYSRICDLGCRLEVLTGEYGETVTNIWIKEPEQAPERASVKNYKTAYRILKQRGTIDNIIRDETGRGEHLEIVKKEIIDGIQYFLDFIDSCSFRQMGYWWHTAENIHQRVTQRICLELTLHQMVEMERDKIAYEYMLDKLDLARP